MSSFVSVLVAVESFRLATWVRLGLGGATGATCATGATGATGVTVTFFAVTGGGTMDWLDCIFISLERRSVATFDGSLVAGGGGGAF